MTSADVRKEQVPDTCPCGNLGCLSRCGMPSRQRALFFVSGKSGIVDEHIRPFSKVESGSTGTCVNAIGDFPAWAWRADNGLRSHQPTIWQNDRLASHQRGPLWSGGDVQACGRVNIKLAWVVVFHKTEPQTERGVVQWSCLEGGFS